MRLSRLFVLSLALTWPDFSLAADGNGDFAIRGAGAAPCSQFIAAAEKGGAAALGEYAGYVAGYTSAYNEMTPETYDVWGWQTTDTALLLLLERCQQDPEMGFGDALIEFTRFYAPTRITTREKKRLVGSEASGFYLYESTYRRLLEALRLAGYPTDDPYASLMRYKVDKKVVQKANVNQILLLRLLGVPPDMSD